MKIRWFMLLLMGTIAGLPACNRQTTSSAPPLPNGAEPSETIAMNETTTPASTNPTATNPAATNSSTAKGIAPLPVPELIPPTESLQRLPQVEVGRSDPFATLPVTPTVVPRTASAEQSTPTSNPAVPSAPTVIPLPPVTISAPVPVVQSAPPNGSAPSALPAPRPVSPTQLAEAIEISGVMEVGGKTNIIVKVPEEGTSRSVQVGDTLANGRVRVKRVEMGLEPVVVLEQNGREVTRSVGSGALVGVL
ncbi:hypothetical protein [Leptolyngbya ohadii]|uniref:hypothetical protein n=1 Tax=Leptolyngbya ohadii TaxID=1962290 RepID=UPI000B5A09F0|nr:hypothetical protein [Leptolyngbya ohadii]